MMETYNTLYASVYIKRQYEYMYYITILEYYYTNKYNPVVVMLLKITVGSVSSQEINIYNI